MGLETIKMSPAPRKGNLRENLLIFSKIPALSFWVSSAKIPRGFFQQLLTRGGEDSHTRRFLSKIPSGYLRIYQYVKREKDEDSQNKFEEGGGRSNRVSSLSRRSGSRRAAETASASGLKHSVGCATGLPRLLARVEKLGLKHDFLSKFMKYLVNNIVFTRTQKNRGRDFSGAVG